MNALGVEVALDLTPSSSLGAGPLLDGRWILLQYDRS